MRLALVFREAINRLKVSALVASSAKRDVRAKETPQQLSMVEGLFRSISFPDRAPFPEPLPQGIVLVLYEL